MTKCCLVDLIAVTLAVGDDNSKLADDVVLLTLALKMKIVLKIGLTTWQQLARLRYLGKGEFTSTSVEWMKGHHSSS